jgi:nicotinate-nucleotide pyrophosphorylase (carboxylating)
MTIGFTIPATDIQQQVKQALLEDVSNADLTADLIPSDAVANAVLITREDAVIAGQAWFDEVFNQLDSTIEIEWLYKDGDSVSANSELCRLSGSARRLLTGERTAMNFLQTLSATATLTKSYVDLVDGLKVDVLDTRKTIPGLRMAQKYAVACGGGVNHRIGLFDAILIKENHINSAGSISKAVQQARHIHPSVSIEVEVENFDELAEAIEANADIVMLDNFSLNQMAEAVKFTNGRTQLEASGNVNQQTIRDIALTGVDRISIGALTKDVKAIDLSMRFV